MDGTDPPDQLFHMRSPRSLHVDLHDVRHLVEKIVGRGREAPLDDDALRLTPRVRKVLELAGKEAARTVPRRGCPGRRPVPDRVESII